MRRDALLSRLETQRYGRSLTVLAETGSTNDDARKAALAGARDGHVVLADHQTAGRGARGARWVSPPGTDLYLSIVCRAPLSLAALAPLTLAVGLGVADAVDAEITADVRVKWPNDVHIDGLKCAGILVESLSMGARVESLVVGIGVDVNRTRFGPELDTVATSLRRTSGREHDRVQVAAAVLLHVETWVDRFVEGGPEAVVAAVEQRLAWRGELVDAGGQRGVLTGLMPDGALALEQAGQTRTVRSGTLRRAD